MIKVRLQGLSEDVQQLVDSLKENYRVLAISDEYQNRNSEYVRVYVDLKQEDQ